MKVIDLLNKIAHGEKVPSKFKYEDVTYVYRYDLREHFDEKEGNSFNYTFDLTDYEVLNDEIEIIEDTPQEDLINHLVNDCGCVIEDTQKEEIQVLSRWYPPKEDKKIEKLDDGIVILTKFEDFVRVLNTHSDKINELIDKVNGE